MTELISNLYSYYSLAHKATDYGLGIQDSFLKNLIKYG